MYLKKLISIYVIFQYVYYNKEKGKNPTGLLYNHYSRSRTTKEIARSMATKAPAEEDLSVSLTGSFSYFLV